ncbi:MAG: N-6 DNA methylase, partial [Chloroflexota bacterium]
MNTVSALQWRDLWALYCPGLSQNELKTCDWLTQSPIWPQDDDSPVAVCHWLGRLYSIHASSAYRKTHGQFFTPPPVAHFMARLCAPLQEAARVVEPAAGTGILIAALAESLTRQQSCRNWHVTAYEIEAAIRPALALGLGYTRHWLNERNISFDFEIKLDDFITANASALRPAPLLETASADDPPQLVIANPPYFKIPKADPRVVLLPEVVHGQPNIYALFMASAAKILSLNGQLVFITPRSWPKTRIPSPTSFTLATISPSEPFLKRTSNISLAPSNPVCSNFLACRNRTLNPIPNTFAK